MPQEPTMESMLQDAIKMEEAEAAAKKGAVSKALGVGLQAAGQIGGAMSAWNDASAYTGFEEADQIGGAVASDAFGRLAQGDIGGFFVSLFRGRELQAQERKKRQKEKKQKLERDLRGLKRGIDEHEQAADKGYGQRIAQASTEAQRYAFSLYQNASGVAHGARQRKTAGVNVRAEAEAEAPILYLAEKLDRLGDARNVLEREIDDSLKSHPGRLKHEEQLQAAIDEVMEL